MVETEFTTSVNDFLGVSADAKLLEKRVVRVADLFLPKEVCAELGAESLHLALGAGLLGPPEVAHSVLLNTTLFPQELDPENEEQLKQSSCSKDENTTTTSNIKENEAPKAFRSAGERIEEKRRINFIWFTLSLLLASRSIFYITEVPAIIELGASYILILVLVSLACFTKTCLSSSCRWLMHTMAVINLAAHGVLLVHIAMMLFPFLKRFFSIFSSSWVVSIASLCVVVGCYMKPYRIRLLSHWFTLSVVLLDGCRSCFNILLSEDKDCTIQPNAILTIICAVVLSALMAETVKYAKIKSYS